MTLEQALDRSLVIQEEITTLLNYRWIPDLPTDRRTQIAVGLLHLTVEQAHSVTLLFQNERYGAGLALTRSVFEVRCRGNWIKHHAKRRFIETFPAKGFPEMRTLIEKLMSGLPDPKSATDFFSRVYHWLSEFVHGGPHMIGMQLSETGAASNYDLEQVKEALMVSDTMQIQAASELLAFARCKDDEYCRSSTETHIQCDQFQADMRNIHHLVQLL